MPHILITNDDGIHAAGLRALVEAVADLGTVSVVAPSNERSASAQSLTLRQPICVEQIAEREWSVHGTPADAMIVALHKLFPVRPDLVISGINPGGNLGENVFYSGTVGAAAEAAINHVAALAVSVVHRGPSFDYAHAGQVAHRLAEKVLASGLPDGTFLNVNVPLEWNGKVRFTRQSEKITRTALEEDKGQHSRTCYWIREERMAGEVDPESDYAAISAGAVSITPLEIDRTHAASLKHLSPWAKSLESAT